MLRSFLKLLIKFHHSPFKFIGRTFSAKVTLGNIRFNVSHALHDIKLECSTGATHGCDEHANQPVWLKQFFFCHKVTLQVCGHTLFTRSPSSIIMERVGWWVGQHDGRMKAQTRPPTLETKCVRDDIEFTCPHVQVTQGCK